MKEFDIFKNTDDLTVERIANIHPILTDEEKERMFAMSERKFNITEKKYPQGEMNGAALAPGDGVEGVEEYDRPAWLRYLSTAAALILLGGGIALCKNLIMRHPAPEHNDITAPPVIATEIETGTTVTSGADNSKYTTVSFDVDSILTGTGTAAAPAAETTPAPATEAPTAAPTQAPTEPTTPPPPTYDIESYKATAKDLEAKWLQLERLNSNYYGNGASTEPDQFEVYLINENGTIDYNNPVYYIRIKDSSVTTIEDYINLHHSIFASNTQLFHDVYGYAEPGGCYYSAQPITEYNGALYHIYYVQYADLIDQRVSGYHGTASTWIGWEIIPEAEYTAVGDTDVIIENPTDTSFDAIIPVCFNSPYGELQINSPYDDANHNYYAEKWHFIIEDGVWKISLDPSETRQRIDYADYMAMLNQQ